MRLDDLEAELKSIRESVGDEKVSAETATRIAELEAEREAIERTARVTMVTRSIEPREIRILPRGDWLDDSGPVVEPSVPTFLGSLDTSGRATRLDLADWLVDAEQGVGGLTARVMVNRFWYLLFGRGISSSLADFGGQGEPPSHGELLDQLAIDFIEDGWSVKRMMRRLVLSRAYRQSSNAPTETVNADPTNRWLARQARFRLPAEMVRDNALVISGLLVRDVGGASVKPHQPAGYYRHLNFPKRVYTPSLDSGQYRRGVYVHWQRQYLHPMLKALDAPSREECTAQRPRSNTPLEALVMLNDPSMVDAAMGLAAQMLMPGEADEPARLEQGFRRTLMRSPDPLELGALRQLLDQERRYYSDHPAEADALVESADDFVPVDVADPTEMAAWTSVARSMLNLYETVTRD